MGSPVVLALALAAPPAAALPPVQDAAPAWVEPGGADFYAVTPGTTLTWSTPGPRILLVRIRRSAESGPDPARVVAVGDGVPFLQIDVPAGADARSRVVVPARGQVLGLHAPAGGPTLFVNVGPFDPSAVPPAPVAPPPVPSTAITEPPPAAGPGRAFGFGAAAGGGVPLRGSRPLAHVGVDASYPAIHGALDLGAGAGWYRVVAHEDVDAVDVYAGVFRERVEWATTVVPLTVDAVWRLPLPLGPVRPLAGGGFGAYLLSRSAEGARELGAAPGVQARVGAEVVSGGRAFGAAVTWSEARHDFGNPGVDGMPAHESAGALRFDLTFSRRP